MKYEIKYKIKRHGAWKSSPPQIKIHYRYEGCSKWISMGSFPIDVYAFRKYRNSYYKEFGLAWEEDSLDIRILLRKSDYERMDVFTRMLNSEYGGDMDRFVQTVVKEEDAMLDAEIEDDREAARLADIFVTGGWRSTNTD